MGDWITRLRNRMAQRQLPKAVVSRHVRIDHKTLTRFLNGTLDHGLQPEQFLRLCEIFEVTPNQVFGLEPMEGAEPVPADSGAPARERLLARAEELTPENRRLVADLIDRLAHHRAGEGRLLPEAAEA